MKIKITFKKIAGLIRKNARFPEQITAPATNNTEFQINPLNIAKLIFINRRLVASFALIFMFAAAVVIFRTPNRYKSTASILPSGETDKFSTFTQLARFGKMSYNGDNNSSILFPDILKSNQVKGGVLKKEYTFIHDDEEMKMTLTDYFATQNPDLLRSQLGEITSIDMDLKIGLIAISVETEYPGFSRALLEQYLAELESFNFHKRRSSAKENVRYLERELGQKEKELRDAEDSLEAYQMANRNWDISTDPEILKMCGRLQRDIEIKSRTFLVLQEQHEIAKLDAQKDVPIVRILDTPSLPVMKSGPHRIRIILLSGIVGFFLISLMLIVIDAFRKSDISAWDKSAAPVTARHVDRLSNRVSV